MIESDHIAALGEPAECLQIAVIPEDDIRDHLRGRIVRSLGEHPKANAESDRRRRRHPGELPGADDPNDDFGHDERA
jgi:hypothetical protein